MVGLRYYDPEVGRWISPDDVSVALGAGEYNLYAYCMNDPVNNIDPSGYFSWKTFWKGVGRVAVGVAATVAAVAVIASGVAPVAMLIVAGVTAVAGLATFVNGTADIGEAASGYNYMRDGVFDGNEKAYNIYAGVTEAVAVVGTAVCGGWVKTHVTTGTVKPNLTSKPYSKYSYVTNQGVKQTRYYGKGGLPIKDIDYFHGGVGHTFPHTHYWEIIGNIFKRLGGR